jgi:arylsulfatase A-like enzyme
MVPQNFLPSKEIIEMRLKEMMKAAGLCAGTFAVSGIAAAESSRPNFVFIMADDLGWGDLGCYGHPRIKTPNIDRLASEGIRFTQFYANSPVCSPTRAAIMTGQFPSQHGFHSQIFGDPERIRQMKIARWLNPDAVQLPRLFQKAGYQTAHIGKWHLSVNPKGTESVPVPEQYGIEYARLPDFNWNELGLEWNYSRSSELFADQSIHFLKHRDSKRPFFMQIWLNDPHNPYRPTEDALSVYSEMLPGDPMTKYWALVTQMDQLVGRMMHHLKQAGLAENTYIIFTSDNGPTDSSDLSWREGTAGTGSAGPFRGFKGSLYEGGLRVPFVLAGPGVPAGRIDETTVFSGVDLLPTFCSLARISLPDGYQSDGEDMAAAFAGRSMKRTKPKMWFYPVRYRAATISQSPVLAIRQDQWKLLINPDGSRTELYDVTTDLTETDNRAAEFPMVAARLRGLLLEWYSQLPPNVIESGAGTLTSPWPGKPWTAASESLK